MKRTYRSKKDTGGALDRRDMLQNLDEKGSAFDVFSIQNIKQTKRELSCVGTSNPYGVDSNKVRKRKYVKRIVKEVENMPQRDTMSVSTYLTPDKSLRVNKILDPFDILLNSSSNGQVQIQEDRRNTFEQKLLPKKQGKTYTRKKSRKVKRYNYSSDYSSESDKENGSNTSPNVTDIRTHDLLVERDPSHSPKCDDTSINRIVNNLSFMNKVKIKALNVSYKHRNRLTNCLSYSPILQKSPLCSTPFKEKYRGKSIYNLSPISINKPSPECTFKEVNNESTDSIVFLCKKKVSEVSKRSTADVPMKEMNESLIYEDEVTNLDHEDDIAKEIELKNKKAAMTEHSIFHISAAEPFLGFSGDKISDSINIKKDYLLKCIQENNSDISDRPSVIEKSICKEVSFSSNKASIDLENLERESLYDTCISDQSDTDIDTNVRETVEALEENSDSDLTLYNNEMASDKNIENPKVTGKDNTIRNKNNDSDIETGKHKVAVELVSDLLNHEKCDTDMNTDQKLIDSTTITDYHRNNDSTNSNTCMEPIVSVQRMSDSMLMKYYKKMKDQNASSLSETNDSLSDDDFEDDNENKIEANEDSQKSYNDKSLYDCSQYTAFSRNVDFEPDESLITDCSTTEDFTHFNDEEDEKYFSFVTTRRRNERNYNILNNSYGRNSIADNSARSSTDCDKTVLSYTAPTDAEVDISLGKAEITVINEIDCDKVDNEISRFSARKSSRLPRLSNIELESSINEVTISNDTDNRSKEKELYQNDLTIPVTTIKSSRMPRPRHTGIDSSIHNETKTETIDCNNLCKEIEDHPKYSRTSVTSRKSVILQRQIPSNMEVDCVVKEHQIIKSNVFHDDPEKILKNLTQVNTEATRLSVPNLEKSKLFNDNITSVSSRTNEEVTPGIVLKPGKKWERSLSIYRRMTDHFGQSILEDEPQKKGRKYRQSIITTMELQDSLHNESINSRRSSFISKPSRSTIRFVKETSSSRRSLNSTECFDDLKGFLSEECDDTVIELSKLSIADSEFEVTVLDVHETSERIATARDYVLRRCNQTDPIVFDECYPETTLKNCHKIGEGVYGEVFLWRGRDGRARVMKIVPIAGAVKVNGETQKDFHEVISEIVIAMELSALRAPIADIDRNFDEGKEISALDLHAVENATDVFNEVLAVRCVQGPYPSRLLDLWELYDECKGSENDNPASLPADQQYIVLELANAGQDLESYQFTGAQQAYALFQQIAFGLAVGEESFQFEHRDLHWGNVLIAPTEQKHATFILRGRTYRVARAGVAATIIDYSLSRISLPLLGERASLYNDLATDEQLFSAQGDYQFQVYRLMRRNLGNDWKNFEPYTNILWLHYTVDKMITALRYKRTNTKIHKHYIEKLKGIKDSILAFKSATDYVLTNIEI